MKYQFLFLLFGWASFAVFAAGAAGFVWRYKKRTRADTEKGFLRKLRKFKIKKRAPRGKFLLSPLQQFTVCVFLSAALLFIPVYFRAFDFGAGPAFLRPLLLAVHNTLRLFILDGEYNFIRDAVKGFESEKAAVLFSFYAAVLYVLAPLLTFSNVLSLFKDLIAEIRFRLHRNRPFYILSEVNHSSVVLAESIVKRGAGERGLPVIVFTDVFPRNSERDYELFERLNDMHAICMKKDVTRLNLSKKSYVEIFLIGHDESENIAQAIKLNDDNCDNEKTRKIFLFSDSPTAGYVLDSIRKSTNNDYSGLARGLAKDMEDDLKKTVCSDVRISPAAGSGANGEIGLDTGFYIRRVRSIETLAVRTLTDDALLRPLLDGIVSAPEQGAVSAIKKISVMILGLGKHGRALMRTVLWLYQVHGYEPDIHILDLKGEEEMKKSLRRDWPEIVNEEYQIQPYDMQYHIHYWSGVDCLTGDLEKLFEDQAAKESFSGVRLAFVCLGDDDRDIETAVLLRRLFDRYKIGDGKDEVETDENELPLIYSVVFDDRKADNLTQRVEVGSYSYGLRNYRSNEYHLRFIGNLSKQYDYSVIENMLRLEREALRYHLDWICTDYVLHRLYEAGANESADPKLRAFTERIDEDAETRRKADPGYRVPFEKVYCVETDEKNVPHVSEKNVEALVKAYNDYEYYRDSSIAKCLHKKLLKDYFSKGFGNVDPKITPDAQHDTDPRTEPVCRCRTCNAWRISEHMRWNAYMRTQGYKFNKTRQDRALYHSDLTGWKDLPLAEQYKD